MIAYLKNKQSIEQGIQYLENKTKPSRPWGQVKISDQDMRNTIKENVGNWTT